MRDEPLRFKLTTIGPTKEDTTTMSNTQQFYAERIVPLPGLETRFNNARAFILQHRPDEQVGGFVSMEGIETMHHDDLAILKVRAGQIVRWTERRADELRAEADEAERVRAESQRQQNMSPLEAKVERLERAVAYLAAEITKLKGAPGRLPALPHVARANIPQILGQPGGMGRPAAMGPGGGGDVRRLARGADASASASAPSTVEQGFTRRQHPLDVIGSSGRRG
jgi:hypothetical protein